jgi:hypothetical protein
MADLSAGSPIVNESTAASSPAKSTVDGSSAAVSDSGDNISTGGGRIAALLLTIASALLFAVGVFAPSFTMIPKLGDGYFEWFVRRFVSSDFEPRSFSLAGGIIHLFREHEFLIGAIILLFSIVFPAAKLATLALSFRRGHPSVHRRLHLLEQLGKWSMLDVFVIAALVVCFKGFPGGSHVQVDWGIYVFGASVVLSMVATHALKQCHNARHSVAAP